MAFPSRNRDVPAAPPSGDLASAGLPPIPPDAPDDEGSERVSAESAGYMELAGAQKDGDCKVVEVPGGLSRDLGCCNLFKDPGGAQIFSCGTCAYVTDGGQAAPPSMPEIPTAPGPALQ